MTNAELIWNFLKRNGFNDYGAAGIMGNLHAESALNPTNLQNSYEDDLRMNDAEYTAAVDSGRYKKFAEDKAGYGIAQWTYPSRKQAYLNFAKARGKSIGDLETQLAFMIQELNQYGILNQLKQETSVYDASTLFMLKYERPANQGEDYVKRRAGYGEVYYKQFATTPEMYIRKIVERVGYDDSASAIAAFKMAKHPFATDLFRKLWEALK